jgi:hypothetical protein
MDSRRRPLSLRLMSSRVIKPQDKTVSMSSLSLVALWNQKAQGVARTQPAHETLLYYPLDTAVSLACIHADKQECRECLEPRTRKREFVMSAKGPRGASGPVPADSYPMPGRLDTSFKAILENEPHQRAHKATHSRGVRDRPWGRWNPQNTAGTLLHGFQQASATTAAGTVGRT